MKKKSKKPLKPWEIVSLEFVLTRWGWENGAEVILLRTLVITTLGYALYTLVSHASAAAGLPPADRYVQALGRDFEKFGVLFGAVYAAFYTRFSSQWTYIANLYNRIMQTQSSLRNDLLPESVTAMIDWKSGFIEDAFALHVANKPMFSAVIKTWLRDRDIAEAFYGSTPYADHYLALIKTDIGEIRRNYQEPCPHRETPQRAPVLSGPSRVQAPGLSPPPPPLTARTYRSP